MATGEESDLLLELPSGPHGPHASPLVDEGPPRPDRGGDKDVPRPWRAPGIGLEPARAATVVLGLTAAQPSDVGAEPAGIALAPDLRFAARSAAMALELATRGRILPALEHAEEGWRARWRPLVDGRDRGRVEALLWAMPGSFLCGGDRPGDPAPAPGAAEGLRTWMWSVTDALARRYAAGGLDPAVPTGRRGGDGHPGPASAWLAALSAPDGAVPGDDGDLEALAHALEAWHATWDAESDPVRTCFRIVPPTPDEGPGPDGAGPDGAGPDGAGPDGAPRRRRSRPGPDAAWRIDFALQAVDDPSLVVPAEDVWADGPELTALERYAPHLDEHLLRGLGRAARLVPSLGPALASAEPARQVVDAAGALDFLRHGAPLLEQAGFGVLAPPWWRSSGARLSLRLKARSPSPTSATTGGGLGLDALCTVRWEAALGGEALSLSELRALARLKQPLVQVRGQWVELRPGDIEAAIAAVDRGSSKPGMAAGEVLRRALDLEPGAGDLPVSGVEADGWLGDLLAGADDRRLGAIATPPDFVGALRPYQERGLGWLAFLGDLGLGACLADDMGLGKTAQLLALLVHERSAAAAAGTTRRRASRPGPTLVLCPMSLVGNWQHEASRFTPALSVYVHHGPDRLAGAAFTRRARGVDLVLSTYGLAVRDHEAVRAVGWHRLVLDEAQHIKNSAARTTHCVRAIPAERRIAMTGTPVENRLAELWSIMQFLNPGLLGSERAFRERFALAIERDGDDEAAGRLRRVTAPFVLRRLKTDRTVITDLPEKLEIKEFCTLTREQAGLYQAVVEDMLARIEGADGIERRGLVLATMMKLKQVCNHPAHFLADGSGLSGRSGKLTRLVEVLDEALAEGDRVLVFTQFTEMGTLLQSYLARRLGSEVLWLHGGVPKRRRDAMVERFQGEGGPPVFLLSLKAGGTGLNLTAATHVVHFDRWWNPAVENQATDRAFRIGQRHNVQVRKLVCGGTVEERIDALIEGKRALAERIVGTGEGWLTELSTDDLRQVVALAADAVGDE
ncbi:MAG TPA: DEAD/DEAH box helicase, partial [Acidimicrobiales bacterium]|nr:DEAD/DEAH box helicase [Acidimicrobiales bacterium]